MAFDDSEKTALIQSIKSNSDSELKNSKIILETPAISTTVKYRFLVAILGCIGVMDNTSTRAILSVAIVAMTNTSDISSSNGSEECAENVEQRNTNVSNVVRYGEFDWDNQIQGIILSSFSYGYLVTQIPGGMLSGRFGGRKVFGFGIMFCGVLNLLIPVAARTHVGLLIAIQVLMGLTLGVTIPAIQSIIGNISPVMQRSTLSSIALQGRSLGRLSSLPIAGALSSSDFLGGWPSVFYFYGTFILIWCVPWFLCVKESPSVNTSSNKLIYRPKRTPWKHFVRSPAVWAIALAHMCYGWMFYTISTMLPTYLAQVLKYNIAENGLISAIPNLGSFVLEATSGHLADFIRKRGFMSTRTTRKVFTSLCMLGPAVLLCFIYYCGCDRTSVVIMLTAVMMASGFCLGGFLVNHIDVSSNYAGELMGISNCLAASTGFMAPTVAGSLINNSPTRIQWQKIFYICAGINMFGAIFYTIFGKGEEQWWNRNDNEEVK